MKDIPAWLSHWRTGQMLLSILLSAVLFLTSGFQALAAESNPTKGTVQLNKIEQKIQEAIDSPSLSIKSIEKQSEGGPNEVQGNADRNKMVYFHDSELPVVKQAEKAFNEKNKS